MSTGAERKIMPAHFPTNQPIQIIAICPKLATTPLISLFLCVMNQTMNVNIPPKIKILDKGKTSFSEFTTIWRIPIQYLSICLSCVNLSILETIFRSARFSIYCQNHACQAIFVIVCLPFATPLRFIKKLGDQKLDFTHLSRNVTKKIERSLICVFSVWFRHITCGDLR